ncbi:MAG: glycosyltransferase family 39 protein [Lachnospiraceae bacterium]
MKKTENVFLKIIVWLMLAVMSFLTVVSLLYRSYIDVTYREIIYYRKDNVLLACVFLAAAFLFFHLGSKKRWFTKMNEKKLLICLLVYVFAVSGVWAWISHSVPTADQKSVLECAEGMMNGNYSCMEYDGYLQYNQHQVGLTYFYEVFSRIFTGGHVKYQAIYGMNTVMITGIFWGLYLITKELTGKKEAAVMELLISFGMFQLMMYSTFAYGLIPGLFFAVFGIYLMLKLTKTGRWLYGILMAVMLAMAVFLKSNYLIFLIAAAIVLLTKAVSDKKKFYAVSVIMAFVFSIALSGMAEREYENRSGIPFGDTIPNTAYLAMGMQDGDMAPGWFNGYNHVTYRLNGYDQEVTDQIAREDIRERFLEFAENPKECLDFYYYKIVSQWNEVTYECFWISTNENNHSRELSLVVQDLYTGKLHTAAEAVMNLYQLLLFAGTLLCVWSLRNKKNISETILILCILGGFLFHILWEGKSQYIISYFPLMIPCAAIGWEMLCGKKK